MTTKTSKRSAAAADAGTSADELFASKTPKEPTDSKAAAPKSSGWYKRSYEDLDRLNARSESNRNAPRRFWMPPTDPDAEGVKICFLDNGIPPFTLFEHAVYFKRSKLPEYFTCIDEMEQGVACPLCELGQDFRSYFGDVHTVIDGSAWKDRQGKVHKNERKLYMAKRAIASKIKRYAKEHGGIRGCVFQVIRTTREASSVGDEFKFVGKLNERQIQQQFPKDAQPFDFAKMQAPKSVEELQAIAETIVPGPSRFANNTPAAVAEEDTTSTKKGKGKQVDADLSF